MPSTPAMEFDDSAPLADAEIHGFHTVGDLDIRKLLLDASTRWFRPNEVHAILSNHSLFRIQPKPVNLPTSGSMLLFDRKMLRNFRKDGHNWKKKKDGKTVQEAHEKLKIGNEERIHVYYARSEDDPNFYRRCYWLLDKNLERIVLVHYRQTSEENAVECATVVAECPEPLPFVGKTHSGSPLTPGNSASGSAYSDITGPVVWSEEINSAEKYGMCTGSGTSSAQISTDILKHELRLHEINTLDWADLVEAPAYVNSAAQSQGDALSSDQPMLYKSRNSMDNAASCIGNDINYVDQVTGFSQATDDQEDPSPLFKLINPNSEGFNPSCDGDVLFNGDGFASQNNTGHWNYEIDVSLGLLDGMQLEASKLNDHKSNAASVIDYSSQQQIFTVTDVSPTWGYCTEETKVLIIGGFSELHKNLECSKVCCVIGETCVATEMIQAGVYRCVALPHTPSLVNLYLTVDGHTPISQVLSFDYRYMPMNKLSDVGTLSEDNNGKSKCEDFQVQLRLAHLLFSTTDKISSLSTRIQPKSLKEAKEFASITSLSMEKDWMHLLKASNNKDISFIPTIQELFEVVLKNKLQEWLLEKVAQACKTTAHDSQGQGVIHLCAILDYAWSVRLFLFSGMSLDFRDSLGWTALHWACYCGREQMVAALLSAGANPSLVTDPTPESPGGCTAADLASIQGYEGLAAYVAEKGLTEHFRAMSLSGNITTPVPPQPKSDLERAYETIYLQNLSEQEICFKESLAAYRNAADAADRIQAAFRDRTLKLQTRAVQLAKPEFEAGTIVAALKIQHAFRNYSSRKMMRAAARIQSHFRTWQARKNYLHMRRQVIRIQAVFRGHQVRRQYRKIIWSVGVLEKAVLRWRLKRKGLRGMQVTEVMRVDKEPENVEEDFFRIGREQAEDRVKRSVVRVQAMFRSYRAQQEYRRMKLAHENAKLEYNKLTGSGQCQ